MSDQRQITRCNLDWGLPVNRVGHLLQALLQRRQQRCHLPSTKRRRLIQLCDVDHQRAIDEEVCPIRQHIPEAGIFKRETAADAPTDSSSCIGRPIAIAPRRRRIRTAQWGLCFNQLLMLGGYRRYGLWRHLYRWPQGAAFGTTEDLESCHEIKVSVVVGKDEGSSSFFAVLDVINQSRAFPVAF